MNQNPIPKGWELKKLEDVCEKITSGGTPNRSNPSYFGGDIIWLKIGDLNEGIVVDSEEKITDEGLQNSSAKLFPKNTVLLAMYGATIGKTGILGKECATNQAICGMICKDFLDSNYLLYFLKSQYNEIRKKAEGAAQPNINQDKIKNLQILLPKLETQKKIVQKLDHVLKQLEEKKKEIQSFSNFQKLKNSKAVIGRLFFDELVNKKNIDNWKSKHEISADWEKKPLGDLVISTKNGKTGRPTKHASGIPRLGITSITQQFSGVVDEKEAKFLQVEKSEIDEYGVIEDDVLFCRQNGNLEFVGKSATYKGNTWPLIFSDSLIRFRVNKELILPDYLVVYTNSTEGRKQIEGYCTTTAGNYSVNGTSLKKIQIELPSMPKQKHIVELKEKKFNEIAKWKTQIDKFLDYKLKTLKKLDLIQQSILNSAFSGKLVN